MNTEQCRIFIDKLTSDAWYIRSDGLISLGIFKEDQWRIEKILGDLKDINYEIAQSAVMSITVILINKEDIISHIRDNKINSIIND